MRVLVGALDSIERARESLSMVPASEHASTRREWRRIGAFVTILYGATYLVQLVMWYSGGAEGQTFRVLAPITMLFPGIAALIFLKASGEGLRFIDWTVPKPRFLLWGALVPATTALVCVVLISSFHLGSSPHLSWADGNVAIEKGPFLLGQGQQSLMIFLVNYAVTAVVFSAVNGVVAAGEEIGWRGFLQKKLVARLGVLPGVALVGLIWAHWHTPVILMGYNYPDHPVLGALLLWPVTCILMSFLLAWLTINGGSVWPAALAHGSWNAFHGSLVDGMELSASRLWAEGVSVLVSLLVAGVSYWAIRRLRPEDVKGGFS